MDTCKLLRAKAAETKTFDWGNLRWFSSADLGNSEALTTGICTLKPGLSNARHQHPNCEEVLHVLSGQISHETDNGRHVRMGPGDTITLPPGTPHHACNTGDIDATLLICFSSAHRKVAEAPIAP